MAPPPLACSLRSTSEALHRGLPSWRFGKHVEEGGVQSVEIQARGIGPGSNREKGVRPFRADRPVAVLRFGDSQATYDFAAQKLDEMPVRMKDGKVTFRILVDRPMYELIGGGGACFKTSARRDMGRPVGTISLTAEGGSLTVESLKVYEMKSAWKNR